MATDKEWDPGKRAELYSGFDIYSSPLPPSVAEHCWRPVLPGEKVCNPDHIQNENGVPSVPVRLYGPGKASGVEDLSGENSQNPDPKPPSETIGPPQPSS